MGTTTAIHALRVPVGSDAPNIPADLLNLANDIDKTLPVVTDTTPTKKAGLVWYAPTAGTLKVTDGSTWFTVYDPANSTIGSTGGALVKSGTFNVTFSGTAAVSVPVTFAAPFTAAPIVTCDVQPITNNTPLTWGLTGTSATGFVLFVRTVNGSTASTTLTGRFIAVGV